MSCCINYILLCLWIIPALASSTKPDDDAKDEDARNNKEFLDAIPYRHQIVYPIQMRMNEVLPDLVTRDPKSKTKNAHYHHTNFEIVVFDRRYRIRLEQNRELLSSGLKQKHDQDEKMQIVEALAPENCYYQGQIRRIPDSFVAVSTCNGIRGLIADSNAVYLIEPLSWRENVNETRFPHVVIEMPPGSRGVCGNVHGMWKSYAGLHQREFLGNVKIMKPQEDEAFESVKHLKLAVVADHAVFDNLNGTLSESLQYFILLANIMDVLLRELKIKISLVYVEIWNQHDRFTVETLPRTTMTTFLQYRLETMIHSDFHFAHFLTGHELSDGKLGMAIPDSICSSRAVAVTQVFDVRDLLQTASGVVHMLGHVLGIDHDVIENCSCHSQYGCVMGQTAAGHLPDRAHIWSTCSNKNLRYSVLSRLGYCLMEKLEVKPTFEQTCGNGVTERSEECDCINKEECSFLDPCCDPKTCLMRPWAMCRHGDCCHNCTVRPNNQMCRAALGECDVPEFCNGVSGECPSNARVMDGEVCENGDSFCYQGECHPHSKQCRNIWGEGAVGADDNCYEMFNVAGRFNGHCGRNASSGEYLKCSVENIKCGLLHCANGTDQPLNSENKTFSITTIASRGNNYQCKIVNGLLDSVDFGMVSDGTKCSSDGICVGTECVSLSRIMPIKCPVGLNGLACSGHGKCTTDVRCFCSYEFTGRDCGQRSNKTFVPIMLSTPERLPSTVASTKLLSTINMTKQTPASNSAVTPTRSSATNEHDNTTMELIIALTVVIVGALIVLGLCLFCYRRKSPVSTMKKKKSVGKKFHGSAASFSSSVQSKIHDRCSDPAANRSISFGPLPSYRADKIKKALRGGLSETESEHSRGDRDSTEIKAAHTLPLAKPPEKGILKKHPRSAENTRRVRSRDLDSNVGKQESKTSVGPIDERKNATGNADRKSLLELKDEGGGNIGEGSSLLKKSQNGNCPADKCSSDDGLDFIDDGDEDDANSSCHSCDDDDENASASGGLESASHDPEAGSATLQPSTNEKCNPKSELQAFFVTATVDEHKKKIRKNIADLLKQFDDFDEQFNNVLCLTKGSKPERAATNSLDLSTKDVRLAHGCVPNGLKWHDGKDPAIRPTTLNGRNSAAPSLGISVEAQDKPPTELPDLLNSGLQKSLLVPDKVSNDTRLTSAKPNDTDLDQKKGTLATCASGPSGLSKPLSQSATPELRTRLYAALTPAPFVPKPATSDTFKRSVLAESGRIPSSADTGAAGAVQPDPTSTVPYRGAGGSASPRLNQRKPLETDLESNRHNRDLSDPPTASQPSALSAFTNKQSISSSSNSEGYQSDRGNVSDEPVVIREIPVGREFSFVPGTRAASAKAPALLSSPEDIDV